MCLAHMQPIYEVNDIMCIIVLPLSLVTTLSVSNAYNVRLHTAICSTKMLLYRTYLYQIDFICIIEIVDTDSICGQISPFCLQRYLYKLVTQQLTD